MVKAKDHKEYLKFWLLKLRGKVEVGPDGYHRPGGLLISLGPDNINRGRFVERLNLCIPWAFHCCERWFDSEEDVLAFKETLVIPRGVDAFPWYYDRCWVHKDIPDEKRLQWRDRQGRPFLRLRFKPKPKRDGGA